MRTPSSSKHRLDLAPPLADQFISGFPIDYGPVLLLMPFGFPSRWTPCPPKYCQQWLQLRLGCIQLSLRARLDVCIPSAFFGQRGITPAFGYGAPHLSARGTSTLLDYSLLSTRFAYSALACFRMGMWGSASCSDFRAEYSRDKRCGRLRSSLSEAIKLLS